ncbi:MAG: S9 family peptidase [Bacteroidales bacterium]|jgi:dipeptidyl aminopeptidase/acylaminoacyl peptidase|nr:S9 family peptidase [Bacteroidales bacterium]
MKYSAVFTGLILLTNLIGTMSAQQKNTYSPELLWQLGRLSEATVSPDGQQVLFGITYYNVEDNKGNRELYVMPVAGGQPQQLTHTEINEANAIWRPDGKKIAYLAPVNSEMQIWEMNPDGTENKQLSFVEGGIDGFKYSPVQDKILFIKTVKMDKNTQDLHPDLPKAEALITEDLMYRHWNAWTDYSYSHVFVADYPNFSAVKDIMEGEYFACPVPNYGGMEEINFSPDGKTIAYTSKKKKGKDFALSTNTDIYLYDIASGKTRNISAPNQGYDLDPVFAPNGKFLAWGSMETDGFESDKKRIFIHDLTTDVTADYSLNFGESADNFLFSHDSKTLYFISGTKATYQLYALDVAKKQIRQITQGQHDYRSIALAGDKTLIAVRESMEVPADIYSVDIAKGTQTQLTFINKELLQNTASITVEERWVQTTDGKQMLVWVILPPHFDKDKKYPAILYCQGGPQSAVSQFFSYRWNFQMMASRGYVVIAPNRRGLPTFGKEWNDQISLDYGGQNMQDYLSAVDAIAKEPFVDETKIGCVGASYGGFSVYWLAGNHNKRFKTFIAHCGMFNFESWYGTTEELFFANHDIGGAYWQTPQPKSYAFSPHHFVGNWDTPLLVIHGGNDFRIPYTQGMQAYNAAQIQGVPSRFLYFPQETHFVLKPQNSILWHREFLNWLDRWLK